MSKQQKKSQAHDQKVGLTQVCECLCARARAYGQAHNGSIPSFSCRSKSECIPMFGAKQHSAMAVTSDNMIHGINMWHMATMAIRRND